MDTTTNTEVKSEIWKYLKAVFVGVCIGFGLGTVATNMSYTHHLMKDCETMKQFRINNLAYECKVK